MRMVDIIAKKRDGHPLNNREIQAFVQGAADGSLPDYQLSALLMAIYLRGMDRAETATLAREMAHSGEIADLSGIGGTKVDKHSTGGVGDKTTLVVAPLVAACGVKVAKMSGRGLGHTGGTIDKLEAIPGFSTQLSPGAFMAQVNSIGLALIAQSGNLAPADKSLYALRDVTATVSSIPLIASSIMSKKLASGSNAFLLDVKTGNGALMKTLEDATLLARTMVEIGEENGRPTAALITDMSLPLGLAIGNGLEVTEALEVLAGGGPEDLRCLCLEIAAGMLSLAGMGEHTACLQMAGEALHSGGGLEKFRQMVQAQGGELSYIDHPQKLCDAPCSLEVLSPGEGFFWIEDTQRVGEASMALGAGRTKKGEEIDSLAGILLKATPGSKVQKGDPLARLQSSSPEKLAPAAKIFEGAFFLSSAPPDKKPLLQKRVDKSGVVDLFPV